jgi:hypothetical protein
MQLVVLAVILAPIAGLYIIDSFVYPNPLVRIALRSAPVLPAAIWTLWIDPSRPFRSWPSPARLITRVLLLAAIMAFAVAVLGVFINWLYDPSRVA